jgi:hypothetical protein
MVGVTMTDRALPRGRFGEARTAHGRLAPPGVCFAPTSATLARGSGSGIVRISARWLGKPIAQRCFPSPSWSMASSFVVW